MLVLSESHFVWHCAKFPRTDPGRAKLNVYGGQYNSATQGVAGGLSDVFETTVNVGGQDVTVRGRLIDGVVRIGTFFIQ